MTNRPTIDSLLAYVESCGIQLPSEAVHIETFGDSPELSAELLALIRSGAKRAGTSLLWAHEFEQEPVPREGEIGIVVDHFGEPVFVTRFTNVEYVPFNEVDAEYAALEGEGDGTLSHWKEVHWDFFSRECNRVGRIPVPEMTVVCSVFEVIHGLPSKETA
ncbi:MAG: ASCH domain-containing protein [Cyanobacteria bacterium P01_G01_bin.54]